MPPSAVPFDELAALGPFFALSAPGEGHTPVRRLLDDAATLDDAIDLYAERLATTRRDIAGSLLLQGWAGRLTSVFAGCAARGDGVPDLAAANLTYRFVPRMPVELGVSDPALLGVEPGWRRLADEHLEPLVTEVDRQCRAGRRRLWGNVAAAMAGSLGSLARAGVASLEELIGLPWAQPAEVADLGAWVPTSAGPCYARRTCCNLVRVPGYSLCSDCVIDWQPRLPPTGQ